MKNLTYIKSIVNYTFLLSLTLITFQGCLFGDDDDDDRSEVTKSGDTVAGKNGNFSAVVTFEQNLALGKANMIMVMLKDSEGNKVEDAEITVTAERFDGTQSDSEPMAHNMENGMYHIMNIQPNKDGKWEIKANITKGTSSDIVTFIFDVPFEPTKSGTTINSFNGDFSATITFDKDLFPGTDNMVMIILKDKEGNKIDDAEVTVATWMPNMGHGSNPDPMVHNMENGMYHIMSINVTMDGKWELKVNVKNGDVTDKFSFYFLIQV